MVVSEQFPVFRLATLLARQLSSPIATRIKEYAKSHPRFGRAVCMRCGRAAAAAELRFKLWSLQLRPPTTGPAPRPSLTDANALEAGADLLGEIILFALGAAIVTFEYNRQAIKQEEKMEAERSAWLAMQLQAEELQHEVQAQQQDLDRLATALRQLAPSRTDHSSTPAPSAPTNAEPPPAHEHLNLCPCPELSTDPPL